MLIKQMRRSVVYGAGFGFLVASSLIFRHLPEFMTYELAKALALAGFVFSSKFRRVAYDNLRRAFGNEKKPREIDRIAIDCFMSLAKSGVEFVYTLGKPVSYVIKKYELVNKSYLDAALSKGKGVILVSAHFGNFPFMIARLACEGYRTAAIMRPLKDPRVESYLSAERERYGIHTIKSIPRKECVVAAIRSLRSNEVIFLPLDQNFGTGGVFVDFFGRKAATATGPVVFSQRTGAAIVPCFIVRQKDNSHKIYFEPEFVLKPGTDEASMVENIQGLTGIIEKYVRAYPAEWSWIHRRWKAQKR